MPVVPRASWRSGALLAVCIGTLAPVLAVPQHVGATTSRKIVAAHATRSPCEKTARTQLALDECAKSRLNAVESRLDGALRTEARHFAQGLVAAAEHRWLGFRSAECQLEASPDKGGSIYPLVYTNCELDLTTARLAQVEHETKSLP